MMEKKNIDRLFQEKFRDFEANPPEYVWDRIEEELNKKKKRRVIPIWWKLSGVAALLLVGLAIWMVWKSGLGNETRVVSAPENVTQPVEMPANPGSPITPAPGSLIDGVAGSENNSNDASGSMLDHPVQNNELNHVERAVASGEKSASNLNGNVSNRASAPATDKRVKERANPIRLKSQRSANDAIATTQGEQRVKDKIRGVETQGVEKSVNDNGIPKSETQVTGAETPKNISPDNQAGPERILSVQEPNEAIAVQDASVKVDSMVVAAVEPNALEELLKEKEKEKEEEKKVTSDAKLNRWQITSNVAPIYFSSASNGSPIDSRLEGTSKSYKTSLSYGAGVQYALNKKFSVRSGVNALALEYATNDIYFIQTPNAKPLKNVNSNLQGSLIQIESDPGMVPMSATGRADKRYDGVLNQRIGYIEVPVEMSYQVLQKRLGIAVIGGFSTLILNQNDVSIEGTGMNMNIGEANNLNPMHFSTNVGLGIKYDFLKSLQFKVEPIVKYQLNTFSNDSGNFKPFFLGIYTGLNYRF